MREAENAGDEAFFIVGDFTVDAPGNDDALDIEGAGGIKEGLGVAFDIEVRFFSGKDDQPFSVHAGVVELVTGSVDAFGMAFVVADDRTHKMLGAGKLKQVKSVGVHLGDAAGSEFSAQIAGKAG